MEKTIYLQALGVVCFLVGIALTKWAVPWARMTAERQIPLFGLAHSEAFIRAHYRFGAIFLGLLGVALLAFGYESRTLGFLVLFLMFLVGAIYFAYCVWRFWWPR